MAANVEILKERYAQFVSGDVEGALANWSDDFEWDGGESDELPGSGIHKGKDAATQVLQRPSARGIRSSSFPTNTSTAATRSWCSPTTR